MRCDTRLVRAIILLAAAPAAFAQRWEFGGGAGFGFYTSRDVHGESGVASARPGNGLSASAWLTNDTGRRLGGEIRYDYQRGDMRLSSGGTTAGFGGQSHAIHYDFQLHFAPKDARTRPFLAFGAGAKIYQGTGTEVAYQPLNQIALLTKTTDTRPLASVGFGVKTRAGKRLGLRFEVHDFLTPFPDKVIAAAQNAKVGGWVQDFVATVGLSVLTAQ
ncbi:MAG TPA: hypothetical protein VFA28_20460 [Bryobacteraceae bacterium]|nr:hypothetical protein [Bryobacteraceae bacterium]